MLQSLRDNLKGTIAVIVVAIFAVPMVLFGVERLFVGSLGGDDVASVGDVTITRTELNRAVYLQKQQLLAQTNADPDSEFLQDENLRGPVLENLISQAALINAARDGGMAIAQEALWQRITQQPQFQTEDGSFNRQRFLQFVRNRGYTTATYLEALAEGLMLEQQREGVSTSSFLTEQDLEQFVALAQQKRNYFSITVPTSAVEDVAVTEEDIAEYYEAHQGEFQVPEKVALDYVEIGLEELAKRQDVSETDVRTQYEQEIAAFDTTPQYEISHIQIEEGDDAAQQLEQAQQALAAGQDFAEVAREYSDDLGTRDSGGYLGRMMADVYPEPFYEAVQSLEEGEVSEPVQTDAGTHLIRVDEKQVPQQPTFAERKGDIESTLRQSLAEQELAETRDRLDELTYSASDLQAAAEELNVDVQSTGLQPRTGGEGVMQYAAVREAAFSEEVLSEGHNSPVLDLPGNRLAVVRVTEHQPAFVQPLAEVRAEVESRVLEQKRQAALQEIAEGLRAQIRGGAAPRELAESRGFEYAEAAGVARGDAELSQTLRQNLFTMPRPAGEQPVLEIISGPEDGQVVLGLRDVQPGTMADMEEQQLSAMRRQLARQMGMFEASTYESALAASADVERN